MRWPLRNQILLPMVGVVLATLLATSVLTAWLSARRSRQQIEEQLRDVARTLQQSSFPLTSAVLRQMRGLSGAQFVLAAPSGAIVASSWDEAPVSLLPAGPPPQRADQLRLGKTTRVADQSYFHVAIDLKQRRGASTPKVLHVFYPERSYRDAWRQAVYPPLLIGAGGLVLVVVLAAGIAGQVTRPLAQLARQLSRIAGGDFQPAQLPRRDDEIRDLSLSINQMVQQLARYEEEVRRRERLSALGQLGSGLAHQLRNAATGCRLAIQLHLRDCRPDQPCQCLDVAQQQLSLMEKHLQRFLALGQPAARKREPVELADVVDAVLPLVDPTARHLGVAVHWQRPGAPLIVEGDRSALQQLLINLLVNAVEAAGQQAGGADGSRVCMRLEDVGRGEALLEVTDSGPGPAADIQHHLYEAFVTDKPDGTGLGLWVARQIVQAHGGRIDWSRQQGLTRFSVRLPLLCSEVARVQAVGD